MLIEDLFYCLLGYYIVGMWVSAIVQIQIKNCEENKIFARGHDIVTVSDREANAVMLIWPVALLLLLIFAIENFYRWLGR
jgi:hypothetical protein